MKMGEMVARVVVKYVAQETGMSPEEVMKALKSEFGATKATKAPEVAPAVTRTPDDGWIRKEAASLSSKEIEQQIAAHVTGMVQKDGSGRSREQIEADFYRTPEGAGLFAEYMSATDAEARARSLGVDAATLAKSKDRSLRDVAWDAMEPISAEVKKNNPHFTKWQVIEKSLENPAYARCYKLYADQYAVLPMDVALQKIATRDKAGG